jgi:hypothetical protein
MRSLTDVMFTMLHGYVPRLHKMSRVFPGVLPRFLHLWRLQINYPLSLTFFLISGTTPLTIHQPSPNLGEG